MTANELRIGNWINYLGKPKKCSLNTIYAISRIVGDSAVYKPMPLTSEILVDKCGFVQRNNRFVYQPTFENIEYRLVEFPEGTWIVSMGFINYNNELTTIKYLHQLQNLYHALSQTELTIDLS